MNESFVDSHVLRVKIAEAEAKRPKILIITVRIIMIIQGVRNNDDESFLDSREGKEEWPYSLAYSALSYVRICVQHV